MAEPINFCRCFLQHRHPFCMHEPPHMRETRMLDRGRVKLLLGRQRHNVHVLLNVQQLVDFLSGPEKTDAVLVTQWRSLAAGCSLLMLLLLVLALLLLHIAILVDVCRRCALQHHWSRLPKVTGINRQSNLS